jgi:hypothetical protein
MPEIPTAIGYKLLPRGSATASDTEQQQLPKHTFDPLAGRSTTVKITIRTNKDERRPDIDYFGITRDVSG